MQFQTHHIMGKGRGKWLGYPTINMAIPKEFTLGEGVYAVRVTIEGQKFAGALHYGPVPVFGDPRPSLEVFLLDTDEAVIANLDLSQMHVEPLQRLREIRNFSSPKALAEQIFKDVAETRKIVC